MIWLMSLSKPTSLKTRNNINAFFLFKIESSRAKAHGSSTHSGPKYPISQLCMMPYATLLAFTFWLWLPGEAVYLGPGVLGGEPA